MPTKHPQNATGAVSTVGMILSLVHTLPDTSEALASRAKRIAHRLASGRSTKQDRGDAATILAILLTATDCDLTGYEDPDCLSLDWDA